MDDHSLGGYDPGKHRHLPTRQLQQSLMQRHPWNSHSRTSESNLGSLVVSQNREFSWKMAHLPQKPVGGLLRSPLSWGDVMHRGHLSFLGNHSSSWTSVRALPLTLGGTTGSRPVPRPAHPGRSSWNPLHYCHCVVLRLFLD